MGKFVQMEDPNGEDFYEKYGKLIDYAIRRFRVYDSARASVEDLRQEAAVAILEALKLFDETKGTWATWSILYIDGYIKHYLTKNRTPFTMPARAWDAEAPVAISFDAPVKSAEDNDITVGDTIKSPESGDMNAFAILDSARQLAASERNFQIWKEWALTDASYESLGKKYGVSRQRVQFLVNQLNDRVRDVL